MEAIVTDKGEKATEGRTEEGIEHHGKHPVTAAGLSVPFTVKKEPETVSMVTLTSVMSNPAGGSGNAGQTVPAMQPVDSKLNDDAASTNFEKATERPRIETFVTAAEELPTVGKEDKA
jgi:hypothetical protein